MKAFASTAIDGLVIGDLAVLAALIACGTIFYAVSSAPIDIVALIAFAILTWLRLDLAPLSVVFFVPYFMHQKHFAGHQFAVDEAFLGVSAVLAATASLTALLWPAAGHSLLERRSFGLPAPPPDWKALRSSPFVLPGVIFIAAVAISAAVAAQKHLALRELGEVVIEPAVLFALCLLFLPPRFRGRRETLFLLLGLTLVVTGFVPSVIAVGQLLTHQHLSTVAGGAYQRVQGPYRSPDNLGLLLDRTLPVAAALVIGLLGAPLLGDPCVRRQGEGNGQDRPPAAPPVQHSENMRRSDTVAREVVLTKTGRRWIAPAVLIAFCMMGASLVLTFVVGAWAGSFLAVAALLATRLKPGWWLAIPLGLLVVVGGGLAATPIGHSLLSAHGTTGGRRIDIWQSALHMIRDHPILGIGPDNFQHYYAPTGGRFLPCAHGLGYLQAGASQEPCLSHPHNEFLDLWLSGGIAGLLAFGWLQVVFWRAVWPWRRVATVRGVVVVGAGAAMLAGLLHGLVDNVYFLVDLSILTWFLFAIISLAGSPHMAEEGEGPELGRAATT